MWTFAGVIALLACASAVTRDQFYPHGPGLDQHLPKGNEVPSPEVPLKIPIIFYGESYESIFVNNFGVLTFRADISSFLNIEFPLPYASIAAFYTNVDTTRDGTVYYRETNEPHVLSKAEESVQDNFRDYYDFKPVSVFITTWIDVPYTSNVSYNTPRNSFQIAVISNGTESFVEFLYPEREIQWFQKESQIISLPDAKAQAGFISEDGRIYSLRGSGSHQIRNIVLWTNTHTPGKYVFRIGQIGTDENVAPPDHYNQHEAEIEEESKTCAQSGPSVCHIEAKCVDYSDGICCQCKEGFYGNGKSCIKNDIPLRVHGKINGVLNNVNLNDVDIQAYVVVSEGRAYTALSLVPGGLGSSLQLLNVLGGIVGWLFAQPLGSAKNGYQLTGSQFNHTADIWFPASGARVVINQEYLGHDVFDQITLETDIRGSLPVILTGTKLDITDYEEQYALVEPGLIRSESSRTFTDKITGEKIEQKISQTIKYKACRFAPLSAQAPMTLKVNKNYLGYESRENIVRYGMTNRIFPLGQEDPCIKGRSRCGPHSTCVAQGDSFRCICQSGFTSIYHSNEVVCIDIDECVAGTHNCDSNADCYNHAGGFQCRCRPGFNGNGFRCNPLSACYNKKCNANAHCIQNTGQEATCICNPGFYGDGQVCYSDISGGDLSEVNESSVQPTCDAYTCVCPPGYLIYRDPRHNQLCRLDNNGVLLQEPSRNKGPIEHNFKPRTEAPKSPYYSSQTEPPYQPNTEPSYEVNTYPPNEADSDDPNRDVLPTCDDYTCVCPPGYTIYKDDRNNQLCRLDNIDALSQEASKNEYPIEHNYQQHTEAPESPYYQSQTERPYQPYSDRPYQPNTKPNYDINTGSSNRLDSNDPYNVVLPTCDAYACACPPGYLMYRDPRNNQLCRLDNNYALLQEASRNKNPIEHNFQQRTVAPDPSYYQSQTEPPYNPNTEPNYEIDTYPPNEPDSDDPYREVKPTCDAYNCVCPPAYSIYRNDHNNQVCRLDTNSALPQEPSGSENQNPSQSTYQEYTEAPRRPYYQPQTGRPYPPYNPPSYSDRPYQVNTGPPHHQNANIGPTYSSPRPSYPAPWESNYRPQQNNLEHNNQGQHFNNNNEQKYYNPYSSNNYDPNNYYPNSNNNNEHTYNQNSANNNPYSQQSSGNNNQSPPEFNEQLPAGNNLPVLPDNAYYRPPETNYNRPSHNNYYETSDKNYDTSTPTNNPPYQPPSSENEYHQSVTTGTTDDTIPCEEDADCPPNAVCSYVSPDSNHKHCVCPEGYEGDAFECIERTGPNCACGIGAHCVNTPTNEYICVCDAGYHGDGYTCRPNSSCRNTSDCEYNAECRPDPRTNEYICMCIKGYIKDQNDACISDGQLCNGALCAEHASCLYDPELSLNYCHCDQGYTGIAISQCIPAEQTCDVANNCSPDAVCTPVENSYQCICRYGFNGDGYICTPELNCRYDPNFCDLHASCLKKNEVYVCECNSGYSGNGSHCEFDSRKTDSFLVASDGTSIYRVPFKVTSRNFATPFNSDQSQVAVDIDVDCQSGIVYWGDVVSFAIKSSRYDGSGFNTFLVNGIKSPEGIAIDWSARNIFWTDSRKLTIEVANLETKVRKVLFAGDRISNPRGIAVHPLRGKVFWSDWKRNDPKIEWASMDGSQRGIFLDKNDVVLPNALAIDWNRDRLCYADAGIKSIICVSIDTKEKTIIASNCSYPFGLTIHGNRFYWTDWKTLQIEYVDIMTQERGQVPIATASRRLYGVAVAPEQCPPVHSVCMYRNGGCDPHQLCLPDGNISRTCVNGCHSVDNYAACCCQNHHCKQKTIIASNCSYPFGLTIHGNRFYWTDWKTLQIEYVDIMTQERGQVPIATASRRLYGVAVAPEQCPPVHSVCMYRNGGCDPHQLCLPDGNISRTCVNGCHSVDNYAACCCQNHHCKQKTIIASNCSYPFGLTIHGNRFYWTDWKTLQIEYVDIMTQERGQVPIATASRRLYGVAVAPEQCPPVHSVCMYRNGGCDPHQLCLPDGNISRTCVNGDTITYRR